MALGSCPQSSKKREKEASTSHYVPQNERCFILREHEGELTIFDFAGKGDFYKKFGFEKVEEPVMLCDNKLEGVSQFW